MFFIPGQSNKQAPGRVLAERLEADRSSRYKSLVGLTIALSGSNALLGRCFDNESHDKDCNRDRATEVGNVRVESFHAVFVGRMSLLVFLWPMAKA